MWGRAVSLDLFGPENRSEELHRHWTRRDPDALVVGYVGRLAPEEQVRRLEEVAGVPGTRLVVVGDGPARPGAGLSSTRSSSSSSGGGTRQRRSSRR